MTTKEQRLQALLIVKQKLESRDHGYICNFLNGVMQDRPDLHDAAKELKDRIENELKEFDFVECGIPTLYEWVDRQVNVKPFRKFNDPIWHLCRMAWVDKLIAEHQ